MLHILLAVVSVLLAAAAVPCLLRHILRKQHHPRGAMAAWFGAVVAVPVGLVAAVGLPGPGPAVHPSGSHGGGIHYVSWPLFATLAVLPAAWLVAATIWEFRRTEAVRRKHRERLRLVAERRDDGLTVLPSEQRAVYCLPGADGTIVVTTGALDVLDSREVAAVVAHERAHLAGRHHHLITLLQGMRRALPFLPVFRAAAEAGRLQVELCADDAAARRHGGAALASALAKLTLPRSAVGGLGASGASAARRVARLLDPPEDQGVRPLSRATAAVVIGAGPVVTPVAFTWVTLGAAACPMLLMAA